MRRIYPPSYPNRDASTIERHKRIYLYLKEKAPYLISLIHKNKAKKHSELIREVSYLTIYGRVVLLDTFQMQTAINRARSDDATHLRPFIGKYAAPDPHNKVLEPPVQPPVDKAQLGFNHPQLARLLCPIRYLEGMLDNPVE
jgi:hypothetical protein